MSNEYGKNAPLSYNKYLRVPELIELQTCLSSPVHRDELLFTSLCIRPMNSGSNNPA
jgi:hypothetical protein